MISFDEAIECIRSVAKPLGTEMVPLDKAAARVLAAPVVAQIDSPRANASVMDGYAVREADLDRFPVSLRVIGESFAGAAWKGALRDGTCARIFTGAQLPAGADRVVIQENVRRDGDIAIIDEHPGAARFVRERASDFSAGEELLPAGRLLDPRAIVAAAGADIGQLKAYRRPRVHILSTGDELAQPGSARGQTDTVPDSASYGVVALAAQWGAECIGRDRLPDDLPTMEVAARKAAESADLVVVTGGASVGEKDFAKAMFERLGLELLFSKVAIKPGMPAWLGRAGSTLVVGLPGNPTSALVTARLLLASLLAGMRGQPIEAALSWRIASISARLEECGAREIFHRGRSAGAAVEVLPSKDSSAQKELVQADLLIRQRANSSALEAGASVDVLDF